MVGFGELLGDGVIHFPPRKSSGFTQKEIMEWILIPKPLTTSNIHEGGYSISLGPEVRQHVLEPPANFGATE